MHIFSIPSISLKSCPLLPWDEESKMEGNYPSARGRERQDSPWLASQCCYAVVRSEGEGGKERWWWVGGV